MIALPTHLRDLIAAPLTDELFSSKEMIGRMIAFELSYFEQRVETQQLTPILCPSR